MGKEMFTYLQDPVVRTCVKLKHKQRNIVLNTGRRVTRNPVQVYAAWTVNIFSVSKFQRFDSTVWFESDLATHANKARNTTQTRAADRVT